MTPPLPPTAEITDIIWLQTGFIGDVVLTTGAVATAARLLPRLRQRLVTTGIGAQALAGATALASCHVFRKSGGGKTAALAAFRALRDELRAALPADARPVVLAAHRSFRSSLLARYLGWPTVAFDEADAAWLAGRRVPRVAVLHEAARIALLLEPLGLRREDLALAMPRLAPRAAAETGALEAMVAPLRAAGAGAPRPLVAIAPGSVWGTKRWTPEGFVALARRLLAETRASLVLIGAAGERALAESIAAALGAPAADRVQVLAGRTTLADLRWLFPQLALLVSNDSSPIHFASALGVPTIALFGATIPEMGFGPLAPGSRALGVELACRPCSDHGPQVCPLGHFKCMRELSADAVFAACRALL